MSPKPISTNEALSMMLSVHEITFILYPNLYEPDKKFKKYLQKYYKHTDTIINDDCEVVLTRDNLLTLLDQSNDGFDNWLDIAGSIEIDMDNIMSSIQRCLSVLTTVETIAYLNTFPNIVYFKIQLKPDTTPPTSRIKHATVYNMPDTYISGLSVNLREILPQYIVDSINEFMIKQKFLSNSLLDKNHVFSIEPLSAWLNDILVDVADSLKTNEDAAILASAFSFLNIPELENAKLGIITDYMVL